MKPVKVEIATVNEELLACRVCLVTDTKLFNIHDYGLNKAYTDVTGTSISPSDGFPQHLCSCCGRLLVKYAEFRTRSETSQDILKQALMYQHMITTSFIRQIDRISQNLTLCLSTHTNTSVIDYQHIDSIKHEIEVSEIDNIKEYNKVPDDIKQNDDSKEVLFKFEDLDDLDRDDLDYNVDSEISDDDQKLVYLSRRKRRKAVEIKATEKKQVEKKTAEKKRVKKVVEKNKKIDDKEKEVKETKKKPKKIKKMFESEEDFPIFESKYNMEIVVLSMEQQLENMAARKESSNYVHSPFKCGLCFKGFSSDATFKNHTMKHHDPSVGAQVCELCHSRFRIPAFLRTHMETHRLKFVCRDCRFVASNRYHAITHFKEHSGIKYVCKYCGATFKKPSTHGTHVRIQHPSENTSCDVCGETFQGDFGLRMHKSRAHKQTGAEESRPLQCGACGVQFASAYAMSRHTATALNTVCNPNMRACTLCGENLATEELLQKHTKERHSKHETKCDECNKSFQSEASLSVHYERVHLRLKGVRRKAPHHARRQYANGVVMCELCGKKCKNSTILKYHQRIHTGERPHGCPRCPKRFISPMLLHCHLRSHTGERPYKCTICHKSFTQKSALTVHKTVHTGEKPFACEICGKSFTQAASVHTHVKYVHMKMPAPPRRRAARP